MSQIDARIEEEKKKRTARPKLKIEDLPTRLARSAAGEDYLEVCMKRVFDRIKFESNHMQRPTIPKADLNESIPRILAENLIRMGITQLLPTQRYTLPLLVDHDTDLFVEAATGHGKTLAFLLPVAVSLLRSNRTTSSSGRPSALVIANTQQLQLQTFNVAKSLLQGTGLRAVLAVGETSVVEHKKELVQGVDILIATTGRLAQFVDEKVISLDDLKYYIYDEADKMIVNDAFINDLRKVDAAIPDEIKPKLRTCFFTATFGGATEIKVSHREKKTSVVRVPGNPLISHHVIPINAEHDNDKHKAAILMKLLEKDVTDQGRTLYDKSDKSYLQKTVVFVGEKRTSTFLAAYLKMYGYSVGAINGDFSLKMRSSVVEQFCDGKIQALIATDAMARGHDIPNVTHVINYDVSDLVSFKHRAGRTARIGHKGTCTTLLSRQKFLLYDNPLYTEHLGPRKEAAKLAGYLVIECGQRVPQCLVKSAHQAIKNQIAEWFATGQTRRNMDAACDKLQEIEQEMRDTAAASSMAQQSGSKQPVQQVKAQPPVLSQPQEFDEDGTPWFPAGSAEEEEEESEKSSEFDENEYTNDLEKPFAQDLAEITEWSDAECGVAGEREEYKWTDEEDEGNEGDEAKDSNYDNFIEQQLRQQAAEEEAERLAALEEPTHGESGVNGGVEEEDVNAKLAALQLRYYGAQVLNGLEEEEEDEEQEDEEELYSDVLMSDDEDLVVRRAAT